MTTATTFATGRVTTWIGTTIIAATDAGLRAVTLPRWDERRQDESRREAPAGAATMALDVSASPEADHHVRHALVQLAEYLAGARREFTVALDPQGASFLRAAWAEVARVPYGETRSYGEIAQAVGAPNASRAVGMANATNPLAPFVPCHRIVGSDGRLTGYGPGLPLKALLLRMEDALPADADDYADWVGRMQSRARGKPLLLGARRTRLYCQPGCERSLRASDTPGRIFFSPQDAQMAGYRPCPRCISPASRQPALFM